MKVTIQTTAGARHTIEAPPGEPILRAALSHGVDLAYDCATGTCGGCKARLVAGLVENAWPDAPGRRHCKPEQILACQSVARGDCELEVDRLVPSPAGASRPRRIPGALSGVRRLTDDVIAFDVELASAVELAAGQFMLMETARVAGARAYSIANADRAARRLSFVAKRKAGGRLTEWMFEPKIEGTLLTLFGPLGRATFDPAVGKHILCIAGGTGIAGMLSIVRRAAADGHFDQLRAHLFFGVRGARDLFWLDELAACRALHPDCVGVGVALSDGEVPADLRARHPTLDFHHGLVHEVALRQMRGRRGDVRAFVAGPRGLVDASIRLLLTQARLPADDIRYDRFD
jgi:NAD(P)H-flavin reductase/ferredoxin